MFLISDVKFDVFCKIHMNLMDTLTYYLLILAN